MHMSLSTAVAEEGERFWADERDCAPDLEVVECRSPLDARTNAVRPLAPVAVTSAYPDGVPEE